MTSLELGGLLHWCPAHPRLIIRGYGSYSVVKFLDSLLLFMHLPLKIFDLSSFKLSHLELYFLHLCLRLLTRLTEPLYQLILLLQLLLTIHQCFLVVLGLASLLIGPLLEPLDDNLALLLIPEQLLDVLLDLPLLAFPLPHFLLQVQLHLTQLLVLLVQVPQIVVGLIQGRLQLTQATLTLILGLLDLIE